MKVTHIRERKDWPRFSWDDGALLPSLASARHKQGLLLGRMGALGLELRGTAQVQSVTEEVVKSSETEGERLDPTRVRSSVAKRLGVSIAGLTAPTDRRTEGVVEMALDATQRFDQPLTLDRLLRWQAALFPTGSSEFQRIAVGKLRDDRTGPMQVVSRQLGKERVHFEAPPAAVLHAAVTGFLKWFNAAPSGDGLLRAGVAHLWLITLHPFDDGNGRVARAVTDMALAQLERRPQRFYSLSSQIRRDRKAYYDTLERTQKGSLDITAWLSWFLGCFDRAIDASEQVCSDALARDALARRLQSEALNERQRMMLNKLLAGLDGKLTARNWAAQTRSSVDTAQRDLKELLDRGLLVKNPGGSKNTSYALALGPGV